MAFFDPGELRMLTDRDLKAIEKYVAQAFILEEMRLHDARVNIEAPRERIAGVVIYGLKSKFKYGGKNGYHN